MRSSQVVSVTMFQVMEYLAGRGIGRTARVNEISREIHLSPSVVSGNLKKLKELGLVAGEKWGEYQITIRGKMLVDIFSKKEMTDEELLQYWVKAVVRPRLLDMQNVAQVLPRRS